MMEFDPNKPIYVQIADSISERVLSGELRQGARIPSVREWGADIGVNPNTVARSYELLVDRGIIFNQRGIGFFVKKEAISVIRGNERERFLCEELPAFIKRAELLDIELKNYIK